jgi:Asp/Glu/hydantoin racemase
MAWVMMKGMKRRDVEGRSAGGGMAPRRAFGGKTVYGARVGILVLDSPYPRIPGDTGNALTWPFPVLYKVVRGATASRVVGGKAKGLLGAFLDNATELVEMGADGITTSCGFLSLYQAELAAHCGVPVAASSLMQVPAVAGLLPPGKTVGVITVSASDLTAEHLTAAGAPTDTPVVGADGWPFLEEPKDTRPAIDIAHCEDLVLNAGRDLVARHPAVGAVVLECTRMVPFASALSAETGLPVYDIYSFVSWFHAGLAPRDFGHPGSAPGDWREL